VLNYVDENRDNLKIKYPYFQNFKTNFIIDSIFLQRLVAYASQKSLVFKTSDFEKSKHLLAVTLKASIARDLWGSSEFYEILNSVDPSYNKSIEVLSKWNSYFSK